MGVGLVDMAVLLSQSILDHALNARYATKLFACNRIRDA